MIGRTFNLSMILLSLQNHLPTNLPNLRTRDLIKLKIRDRVIRIRATIARIGG